MYNSSNILYNHACSKLPANSSTVYTVYILGLVFNLPVGFIEQINSEVTVGSSVHVGMDDCTVSGLHTL